MILAAQSEAAHVKSVSFAVKGAVKARQLGSVEYASFIKGVLFYLRHGRRPVGLKEWEFRMIRPLVENLVKKGQLKSQALEEFDNM